MIPGLWFDLREGAELPYSDPLRERWLPTWPGAMIHALATARRHRVPFKISYDAEFRAWIARPRNS